MATAVIEGRQVSSTKKGDSYLTDGSSVITPLFNIDFDEGLIPGSLFSFTLNDADKMVFSSLIPVFRRQLDVVVTIEDENGSIDYIDSSKTQIHIDKNGTFAIYNEDFEKLSLDNTANVSIKYKSSDKSDIFNTISLTVTGTNEAPIVDAPLVSETHEENDPYTIDLLDKAHDIDFGAVLHVEDVSEADGQGGWTLSGNIITVDPDYFDALNDGEFGHLNFTYRVIDEYGASVGQTLNITVEGYTDPPSLEVEMTAGDRVNEMKLHIISAPHTDERVELRFDDLDPDAKVYDADGNDVTSGIQDYYTDPSYGGDHTFTVVMSDDVNTPVNVTAAGYKSDGSFTAEAVESVELLYDINNAFYDLAFTNVDQSMWGNFDFGEVGDLDIWNDLQEYGLYVDLENLNLQFHEYYPILGNDFMQWDKQNGWKDTGAEYWRSGKFNVIDISLASEDINEEMLAGFKFAKDAAQALLAEAQAAYDTAGDILDAIAEYDYAKGVEDAAAAAQAWLTQLEKNETTALNNLRNGIYDAAYDIAYYPVYGPAYIAALVTNAYLVIPADIEAAARADAHYVANLAGVTAGNLALGTFDATHTISDAIAAVIDPNGVLRQALIDAAQAVVSFTEGALKDALAALDALEQSAESLLDDAIGLVHDLTTGIENLTGFDIPDGLQPEDWQEFRGNLETALDSAVEGSLAFLSEAAEVAYNLAENTINTIDYGSELTVNADLFARVGLQLDFILDAGSVDTDVRYTMSSITEYNQTTDMLVITPVLQNVTNGNEYVPFSTISPNASIYAALLYDVGADLDVFIDGSLAIADYTIYDLGGINFSPTISTTGTNYMFEFDENGVPYIVQLDEVMSYQDMLQQYGIELDLGLPEDPGKLVILDLDSADTEAVALPGLDDLTKGIIEKVEVAIPTIETEGSYVSQQDLIDAITSSYTYQLKDLFGVADDPNEQTFAQNIDDFYYDEAIDEASDLFAVINLEQLTSAFENATIELGEKVSGMLAEIYPSTYGSLTEFLSQAELDEIIVEVASGMAQNVATEFLDFIDGEYETGTILMVDLTNTTSAALFHYNTWDFNTDKFIEGLVNADPETMLHDYQDDINEGTASLGLYASAGESDPFVSITVDVDAIAAVVISQILKKVAEAVSAGAATVLEAIPDELLNPFEQKLGLETLLKIAEVPEETASQITDYLNLEYTYTRVDADVIASADFSQEFTLTVDDMTYLLTMEDNSVLLFSASEVDQFVIENASQYDADGNGIVEYVLQIVPTAMFSNDTELGLNLGLNLDFLAAEFEATMKLPLAELLDSGNANSLWPTLEIPIKYSFGPLLEINWAMNGLDIDFYEARFEMDIGTEEILGNSVTIDLIGTPEDILLA